MVALAEIRNEVIEIGAPSTLKMEELTAMVERQLVRPAEGGILRQPR